MSDEEDLSADALSRLWRVRKTLAQMLSDRDYVVLDEDEKMSFDEFKEKFGATAGLRCAAWSVPRGSRRCCCHDRSHSSLPLIHQGTHDDVVSEKRQRSRSNICFFSR